MADVKFSALPAVVAAALADMIALVQGGVSKRATLTQVRAVLMPAVLTADVSGILPAANGGTGAAALPAGGLAGLTALAAGDATSVATAAADATTKANAAVATAAADATTKANAAVATSAAAIVTERTTARTLTNVKLATGPRVANATTGDQNDIPYGAIIELTDGINITGINAAGVVDGQECKLLTPSLATGCTLQHETGSAAANQISCYNGAPLNLYEKSYTTLIYDGIAQKWKCETIPFP
jgi:hypothetical protein